MRNVIVIAFLAQSAFIPAAWAGPREDTLAGISRCAALPDDRTFLDCIYGAVQPMRARLGLQPALASQQRLVPHSDPALAQSAPPRTSAAPATPQGGGVLDGLLTGSGLHMAAYSFDKRGLFTVTLSDGTVWRQNANDTNFAHFGGKASNYSVSVTSGEFGSRMDVRGEPGPYRVERIQ